MNNEAKDPGWSTEGPLFKYNFKAAHQARKANSFGRSNPKPKFEPFKIVVGPPPWAKGDEWGGDEPKLNQVTLGDLKSCSPATHLWSRPMDNEISTVVQCSKCHLILSTTVRGSASEVMADLLRQIPQ